MHKQIHTYIYTKKRETQRERERERENLEQRLCLTRKGLVGVEREGEGERRSIVTFW